MPKQPVMQSISILPLSIRMNAEQIANTREVQANLQSIRERPHLMDDETIDRILKLYTEAKAQGIPAMQAHLVHWRKTRPSAQQTKQLDHFAEQLTELQTGCDLVLAAATEIRKGTIDRVMAMSDEALGLANLRGETQPPDLGEHVPARVDVKRYRCPQCEAPIALAIFAIELDSISHLQDVAQSVSHHLREFDVPARIIGRPLVEDILAGRDAQDVRHVVLNAWPEIGNDLQRTSSADHGRDMDALLLKHRCNKR